MGTEHSANDEWIELYNSGETRDVSGWTLSDGNTLEIVLAGTISAGAHVLLERTDDQSAPPGAFLIYTGSLSNEGRTLTLYNESGGIEDRVAGGEGWENVGGDNTSKATAQRTNAGWITAESTPGAQNETMAIESVEEESEGTETKKSVTKNVKVSLVESNSELQLALDFPEVGFVHQGIHFAVMGSGVSDEAIDSLSYQWNFGDGYTSQEKDPVHVFKHPGTYVVVVNGSYVRHDTTVRSEITILPVSFSMSTTNDGYIRIHNEAPYEVDLSGYTLRGIKDFAFEKNTYLLPNSVITVAGSEVGGSQNTMLALYDTEMMLVASHVPEIHKVLSTERKPVATKSRVAKVVKQKVAEEPATATATSTAAVEEVQEESVPVDTTEIQVAAPIGSMKNTNWFVYTGLAGLLILGTLGLYVRKE